MKCKNWFKGMIIIFWLSATSVFSQTKNKLIGTWKIHKYEIFDKLYAPDKKDKNDFISLGKDFKFKSKSEGKLEVGSWLLKQEKILRFTESDNTTLDAFIYKITDATLVLKYRNKQLKNILFHYKK